MKILIIEDDEDIRQGLYLLLGLNGHTVLAACDGFEGLKLAQHAPDFIFCDITMPGMDGFQTIEEIQKLPACRSVPFVFLTAMSDREAQRRGMTLGADDFITKPFIEQEILDAIEARFRRQQPLRERIHALQAERRREVLADWSHELMTPLTGVLGGLELIEAEIDTISTADLKELIGIIRGGAERQQRLSKKLTLYFELEQRKASGVRADSCTAAAFVSVGASAAAQSSNRESDLSVQAEPGVVSLIGEHLRAAVAELVLNACVFSKPGQPIIVKGAERAGRYLIEVLDQGSGLTPEQCGSVAPFRQFGRKQQNQQGLGLGLAIVRSVAEIAGGTCRLQRGPDDRGLHAILDLPCVEN